MSKKAIIVGASSGIGKALAIVLAQQGYTVGITGRRGEMLNEIKALYPEQIITMVADATHPKADEELDALVNQLGGLDLLIISAGVAFINKTLDFALEDHTNQLNVVAFTKLANWGMHFFERQGHGHMANISSVASRRGGRHAPAYHASKAYQSNYFEGLRQRFHKRKLPIATTDIRPGFVDTAMAKGNGLFWVATKEKAAKQIYRALQRKKAVVYITKRWRIIGFIFSNMPKWMHKRL
ncbi:SDR family NAD(P)-dependent oxidoreductase [Flavobacteriaceae bacterium]|nr:SDR family NAD(P)-dependent oxidoreductase [Flavobacteriaceae bacterium]MDA9184271.1 SDR family NAD(P)-dependent oxidoreductase [Flavobacteriaceae bacterium]MDB4112753.1 SDR family NAD(P)-dependent oxidoreductase [Flavobacteriaceae bacterium]MDB4118252.1 SDR family NAD(P)-dependent oxidoreductase [Flavobacteriaceae bacterium]MDB4186515.1 SDR family NAD(P)-dependent oxidoreductase [Flavobacteriaceae bacterium]